MPPRKWTTVMAWPDSHVPYHHQKALKNAIYFAETFQPDRILFLGDFLDMKGPARWSKAMAEEYQSSLQKEIDAGVKILRDLRDVYAGPIDFIEGNHEERITNYLAKYAPALSDMRSLQLPELLEFDSLNITFQEQPYQIAPGFAAIHGHKLRQHGGMSALAMSRDLGQSIVQGHSHRLGIATETLGYGTRNITRFGVEAGHFADAKKAEYLKLQHANWQMGFALLNISGATVLPEVIPVANDGSFRVHGVDYV